MQWMRMRVASYNIHRGFGRDGRYDPNRILRVLQEMDADIVALQEVEFPGPDPDQILTWLAVRLGMIAVGGPVRTSEAGTYGNALLTRYPVRNVRRWDLSVGTHEPRGALAADMLCQGAIIHVVTTHLGLWPKERPLQATRLLEFLQVPEEELTILMGDLNEWQLWGKSLRVLRRVFGSPAAPPTFPTVCPILALDRIWVSPPQSLRSIHAHHSGESLAASDHLPVKAEVCFQAVNHARSGTA
jgi:endonuclease/exonuclease/phosphatase family metal-dependent hydrolase